MEQVTGTTDTGVMQISISPPTVYFNSNPDQSSYADLTVTLKNSSSGVLSLSEVGMQLPVSLYQAGSFSSIGAAGGQEGLWNVQASEPDIAFKPASGNPNLLAAGASYTFTLQHITLANTAASPAVSVIVKQSNGSLFTQQLALSLEQATQQIVYFTSTLGSIEPGGNATLSWNCTEIDYCRIDPLDGPNAPTRSAESSVQVSPPSTQLYTLYAFAHGVQLSAQRGISVENPEVVTFGGIDGQTNTDYNTSVELVWTCNQDTQSVKISCDDDSVTIPGNLNVNGSVTVGPLTRNTNFTLTAYGNSVADFGSHSAEITINAPTAILMASPDSGIWEQDVVTLSWNITSATNIVLNPPVPNGPTLQNPTGAAVITPGSDITYTLTATGVVNTNPAIAAVQLNVASVQLSSFNVSPNPVPVGYSESNNEVTFNWNANAQLITINNGVGNVSGKSSVVVANPPDGAIYTLSAGTLLHPGISTLQQTIINMYGPFIVQAIYGVQYGWSVVLHDSPGLEALLAAWGDPAEDYFTVSLNGVAGGDPLPGGSLGSFSPGSPPTCFIELNSPPDIPAIVPGLTLSILYV